MIDSDALTWNAPDGDHPARRASQRSAATVARGVKEDWLALFAPDAVVEDPVGPSMFDPEGKGHHGHDGIARFWDIAIAGVERFHFAIEDSFANGDSCALWPGGAHCDGPDAFEHEWAGNGVVDLMYSVLSTEGPPLWLARRVPPPRRDGAEHPARLPLLGLIGEGRRQCGEPFPGGVE